MPQQSIGKITAPFYIQRERAYTGSQAKYLRLRCFMTILQNAISRVPPKERPRERCLEKGSASLSLRECIALVLGSGPRGVGCLGLASQILAIPGQGLSPADEEKAFFAAMEATGQGHLALIPGVGPAGRARLSAAFEIAKRYAASQAQTYCLAESRLPATSELPSKALTKVPEHLRTSPQEWLGFVAIHRNGSLGDFCLVERGTRTHVNIDVTEFFARLLALRPRGFYLFHNHPSGDTTPSRQDRVLTFNIRKMADEFKIELLGHWVVAYRSESWIR